MVFKQIRIENYRALRDVTLPLSQFGCLIGENNAGKSSALVALSLFINGTTIASTDFFNAEQPVRLTVELGDISEDDLSRLTNEQRSKIQPLIAEGTLTLIRHYGQDGKSRLRQITLESVRPKHHDKSSWGPKLRGKRGAALRAEAVKLFRDLESTLPEKPKMALVESEISKVASSITKPPPQRMERELSPAMEKLMEALLPEAIYIPAVKDLSDDVKSKESAPFGKILKILLEVIQPELGNATEVFGHLREKLNVLEGVDGTIDNRLEGVKRIETTLESELQHSFPAVKLRLEVPPPEMRTILAGARLMVDDGMLSNIETKGDGLKRATVFAILRAFQELSSKEQRTTGRYFLLFEEPELYLHPKAQQVLFGALATFAKSHHALVTTHSPSFLSAQSTTTFVKMVKRFDERIAAKPYSVSVPIQLGDLDIRRQFQVICYENNNHAFFAQTVVLVEGPSDAMVLTHIARLLSPDWDSTQKPVAFARVNGKGSIGTYRQFFSKFEVRVVVVADLDVVIQSFDTLGATDEILQLRERLLNAVDEHISRLVARESPSSDKLKRMGSRGDIRSKWQRATKVYERWKNGECSFENLDEAVSEFLNHSNDDLRLNAIQTPASKEIEGLLKKLLEALYRCDVFLLRRGQLEDYYPTELKGKEKTEKAIAFCQFMSDPPKLREHLNSVSWPVSEGRNEFDVLFDAVFGTSAPPNWDHECEHSHGLDVSVRASPWFRNGGGSDAL